MQFIYDIEAGNSYLTINGDRYKYLFKIRRHKSNDKIFFRNLEDDFLYEYIVKDILKKEAFLVLEKKCENIVKAKQKLHIIWCVIDPKIVEKYISALNEIGVDRITFIYSSSSQKNFRPNLEKLRKILINSSQQCGRSSLMKLDINTDLEQFLKENPHINILDFSNDTNNFKGEDINMVLIGPEGGFSKDEKKLFNKENIIGLDSNLILRSETASISIASKILL